MPKDVQHYQGVNHHTSIVKMFPATQKLFQFTRCQGHLHCQGFHRGNYYFGHRSHHGSEADLSPHNAKQLPTQPDVLKDM